MGIVMGMAGETRQLLNDWHGGDKQALGQLLDRNLGWIQKRVSHRMGPLLQAKGQTSDYVQDAVVEVLRYGPKFVMTDEAQFRALMAKIVENVLRGRNDWFTAGRRAAAKERAMGGGTVIDIDPKRKPVTRPSQAFARDEAAELARLAISLLDEADREVIILRQWDDLTFGQIAERLGIKEPAARMRFERALPKLAEKVVLLRRGDIGTLIGD